MTNRIQRKHIGLIALGAGILSTALYVLMINVTLAHIEAVAGQVPFDMRPFGYGSSEAATLLNALGVEGRNYYLSRQIPLDLLYPAMFAVTLIATVFWFGKRMPNSSLVRLGINLAVGAVLFDYAENLGIVAMIRSWPDTSDALVFATSAATIAKSALTTLAVLLTLVIGCVWARLPKAVPGADAAPSP
jgi:hypothetical protein